MKSLVFASLAWLALAFDVQAATKVVSTGDSLTCLISADMPAALAAFGGFEYPNPILGNGGSDTAAGEINSRNWVGSETFGSPEQEVDFRTNCVVAHPDVVLLMIGTNDAFGDYGPYWNQWSLDRYKANVDDGVQSMLEAGIRVVLGSITPCNEDVAAAYRGQENTHPNARFDVYNAWLKQEADLRGCLFLDTNTAMRQLPNWDSTMFGVDGLNYSLTGEVWMANQSAQAAELATQTDPVVITSVKVNSVTVGSLHVVANLTADSLTANSLTIGGDISAVPEPSVAVFLAMGSVGLMGYAWRRRRK